MITFYICTILLLIFALLTPTVSRLCDFTMQRSLKIKGILALLVIFSHCGSRIPIAKPWGAIAVGVFMFLTGYGLYASYLKKGTAYLDGFFRKRFVKLLPPLVIATVIYCVYLVFTGKATIFKIIENMCVGNVPIGATWYVYAILYFYVLFYISIKFGKGDFKREILNMTMGLVFYCFLIYILHFGIWWSMSSPAICFGMAYCFYEKNIKLNYLKHQNLWLLTFLIGLSVYFLIIAGIDGLEVISLRFLMPIYWLISIPIILVVYKTGIAENKLLNWLGGGSYEAYIVHDIFVCSLIGQKQISTVLIVVIILCLTYASAFLLKKLCGIF